MSLNKRFTRDEVTAAAFSVSVADFLTWGSGSSMVFPDTVLVMMMCAVP